MKNTGYGIGFKENIKIFDKFTQEYDNWFERNRFVYKSELLALKKFIPKKSKGLEIGVGTGRFVVPLGIRIGVEPAGKMADIARRRGIEVYEARAEKLPFNDRSFNFILMVTTICFLENPLRALKEIKRILKLGGHIIIGMIDKDSSLGKLYESKKKHNKFYRYANFYSVSQILELLSKSGYNNFKTCQTIFRKVEDITSIEPVKNGYGEGGFVVISANKI